MWDLIVSVPDHCLSFNFLYKSKGDPTLPENYRPVTILSCMGTLFTAILISRLNNYLEESI